MKESIGSTQLFIIVVVLVLIFAGIMSFTIKRSNAFALKDKIITTIENDDGIKNDTDTIKRIIDEVENLSYRQIGKCQNDYYAVSRSGETIKGGSGIFCYKRSGNSGSDGSTGGAPQKYYYDVIVFYGLDIPIINENFTFKMESRTKAVKY